VRGRELRLEDGHHVYVNPATIAVERVTAGSFRPESRLLVAAEGTDVPRERLELHPMQAEFVEREPEHQPSRFRAVSLAPMSLLPDHDPECGAAVLPVELVKTQVPDMGPSVLDPGFDAEDDLVFPVEMCLEPPLFLGQRQWLVHQDVLPHLRVVEPPDEGRDVPPLDRP